MPKATPRHKIKTHRGAAKRFLRSAAGYKRRRALRNHILTKKPQGRKRRLRSNVTVRGHDRCKLPRLLGR